MGWGQRAWAPHPTLTLTPEQERVRHQGPPIQAVLGLQGGVWSESSPYWPRQPRLQAGVPGSAGQGDVALPSDPREGEGHGESSRSMQASHV